ncbi:unnamed protein product [Protopolystoma xenopodis]|uniref:PH domain-containing protein n=1 Tax=Protopolystoma xenopodis TaxID=117903 RepID=A0A3S5B8Y5_9PLAT|nr:unnamed protein product [Protopolystoma xenopodis]
MPYSFLCLSSIVLSYTFALDPLDRRISCKDLGQGDCQGWLWLKQSNSFTSKYVKRWCVFKHNTLYYYRNPEDESAEGLIHLHGFTITPSVEVKSGRLYVLLDFPAKDTPFFRPTLCLLNH